MVREHKWRVAVKCVVCKKTGKVQDPNFPDDPEKLIKCINCGGYGMKVTSGSSKAD